MLNSIVKRIKDKTDKRTQKILKNIVFSLGIKGLSIVVAFLTLPVYIKFLTNESVLGVWLTLISMLSWIFMFDLGIGNGLRNQLTKSFANNDFKKAKKLISSAYVSSFVICVILIASINKILSFVDFIKLFNVDDSTISGSVLNLSIRVLLIGVLIQFVLKLINSILLSIHKSAIPNSLSLISNIALLLFMFIMPVKAIEENFLALSFIYVFTTNIPMLIASIIIFSKDLKDCRPSLKDFDLIEAKNIIKLGVVFLWLQIMVMAISSTNNFLISTFVGAKEVVPFQIYNRLFSLVSTFFMIGLTPIWSSVTDALENKEYYWILKLRKKLFRLMGIAAIGELVVLIMSRLFITVWMGKEYVITDYKMIIFVAIFDLINIWSAINANIVGGLGKLKNAMVYLTIGAIINIPLSYYFSILYNSWVAIVIANIVSLLPYCISETISTTKYFKNILIHGVEEEIKYDIYKN